MTDETPMPPPLIIDTHFHLYRNAAEGEAGKAGYEIWEYGPNDQVRFSARPGDYASAVDALESSGTSHAVVTNLLDVVRPGVAPADDLVDFNHWLCDEIAARDPRFIPLIGVDPNYLSVADNVAHLELMARDHGAQGIKLHPPLQRLDFEDRAIWPIIETCARLDLAIVSHSGPSRDGSGRGEPDSFRPILSAFPTLRIVLAHMGGATWRQLPGVARDFSHVQFDLCEIVEQTGAPRAPSTEELSALIREVGPGRVMMGSDFPWYDIDHTIDLVLGLPGLSTHEKHGILGANAARFFRLTPARMPSIGGSPGPG
jgi:predicted TIM-barrel fold metal-dependent hydrolase